MAVLDSPGGDGAMVMAFGRNVTTEATPEALCGWRVPAQPASLVLSHQQMPQTGTAPWVK